MKKFKKLTFLVTAIMMLVAMTVTNFGFVFAADPSNVQGDVTLANGALTNMMPSEIQYGKTVTLPALPDANYSYVITSPLNKVLGSGEYDSVAGTFVAKYLGIYKVELKHNADGSFYDSFKIKVVYNDEPFIEVNDNGADIPTYIKKGTSVMLPDAVVYVLDDDDNKIALNPQPAITKSITGPDGEVTAVSGKFDLNAPGSYYVRYEFAPDANGSHKYSKDYVIKSQDEFKDETAPLLSRGTLSSEYSVRTAIAIPTATASDSYDDNVRINVRVTDPDGNSVMQAETYKKKDAKGTEYTFVKEYTQTAQVFKNHDAKTMTFYPAKTGKYKVQYWAVDDSGNGLKNPDATENKYAIENAKDPILYEFDVVDRQGPRFLFTAAEEADIPTVWSTALESGKSVRFPIPLIIDNLDGSNENYAVGAADMKIKVDFNIKNPNSKQVLTISDIYTASDKNIFVANGAMKAYGEFKFGDIPVEDRVYGDYTVTYTTRDSSNVTSTKTFKISLSSDIASAFDKVPELVLNDYASFVKLDANGEGELKLPSYKAKDQKDTNVKVEIQYALGVFNGSSTTWDAEKTFEDTLVLKNEIGTDHVNVIGKNRIKVVIKATNDYDKTATKTIDTIKIINPSVNTTATWSTVATASTDTEADLLVPTIEKRIILNTNMQHEQVKLGRFVAKAAGVNDEFAGVTMIIRQPGEGALANGKGDVVNSAEATYINYFRGADTFIVVEDILFTPTKSGWHSVSFVCDTVDNKILLKTYYFEIKPSGGGSWGKNMSSNATVPGSMEIGQTYTLPKMVRFDSEGNALDGMCAYRIKGPLFTINGTEFTPKAGVVDFSIKVEFIVTNAGTTMPNGTVHEYATYSVDSNDTVAPVINIVSPMQFYSKKFVGADLPSESDPTYAAAFESMTVKLPEVAAFDINGISKVEFDITDKTARKIEELDHPDGYKYFKPETDGKYTINVIVSDGTKTATMILYVYAGDIVPPEVTIDKEDNIPAAQKQNYKFTFNKVAVKDSVTSSSNITVVKTLLDPNKTEILRSTTLEGDDSAKLEKIGTYTVVYLATDEAGNETRREFSISVSAASKSAPIPMQTLSTILIIAAVLLLIGVIVYFVRYRRIKS